MVGAQFFVMNAFAERPFGGNPAAVFPDAREIPEEQLQPIARQLNLVETVFAYPVGVDGVDYRLRYFTPLGELPIAGHPTVATWVALAELGVLRLEGRSVFTQQTGAGRQQVAVTRCENRYVVSMKQPPPTYTGVIADTHRVAVACGLSRVDLDETLPVQGVSVGLGHIIVPVKDLKTLMQATMRIAELRDVCSEIHMREVQLFTFEALDSGMDLYTRNFTPREGLEDPACGNGNGALGAYLAETKYKHCTEFRLMAQQGHGMHMPAVIRIDVTRDGLGHPEVSIAGSAIRMVEGRVLA